VFSSDIPVVLLHIKRKVSSKKINNLKPTEPFIKSDKKVLQIVQHLRTFLIVLKKDDPKEVQFAHTLFYELLKNRRL